MVNYDNEFAGLLQNAGHLVPFMDAFFGFLYRRTDFFCIRSDTDDGDGVVGFPEGSAEKILLSVFRRYQTHAKNERENSEKLSSGSIPEATQEVEVTDVVDFEPIPNVSERLQIEPKKGVKADSVAARVQDESESFNGADLGHYKWSQSSTDVDVTVLVDQSVRKGSQIQVDVKKDSIKVSTKDGKVLLEGQLFAPVKCNETIWNLIPGKQISLSLEKSSEKWWNKLLTTDKASIETEKLHIEQPLERLSTVDKMAVEKAVHQQQEKHKQNDQLESLLREAWDKDGSPFKGQPFDPSVLNNIS